MCVYRINQIRNANRNNLLTRLDNSIIVEIFNQIDRTTICEQFLYISFINNLSLKTNYLVSYSISETFVL